MSSNPTVSPRLVSTIIPVYNRAEMIVVAVQSVLEQTYRPIEIILADDGSTDDTPEACKRLVQQHDGIVHYIRHENAGPGPARELGRSIAKGEFIQYLDSDDRLLPNKFTDQVAALDQNPDCDVAYGITKLVNSTGEVLADPFKWTHLEFDGIFPRLLVDRWWCTHTPLYRRSLTDKIGSWCDMRWSQDWEYDARIGALKTKIINCKTHVSEHCHHDGERQTSKASWQTDPVRLRNRVRLLKVLWSSATTAGIDELAPERQHFARWCFAISRQCAAQKMRPETLALLDLANQAATSPAGRKGLFSYQMMIKFLGCSLTAKLLSLRNGRSPGNATMDQSFADASDALEAPVQ